MAVAQPITEWGGNQATNTLAPKPMAHSAMSLPAATFGKQMTLRIQLNMPEARRKKPQAESIQKRLQSRTARGNMAVEADCPAHRISRIP